MKYFKIAIILLAAFALSCSLSNEKSDANQEEEPVNPAAYYDSGGIPLKEQSAYDVNYYDLNLAVDPEHSWIGGSLQMTATVLQDLEVVVLHLDTLLKVSKAEIEVPYQEETRWERNEGLVYIYLNEPVPANGTLRVKINYSGNPLTVKDAKRRTWSDGFYFEKTPDGHPWVGNVSVLNGADIWWPCKDHPSDEADSMAINITVPNELVVATNGKLRNITENEDDTKTWHWFVSTPVNNYAVSINIAPYKTIETEYISIAGDKFPFIFWVIPEHFEQAQDHFQYLLQDMKFFEEYLGPYPFRADKYGVAETFYFGMETQSIIAYGSDFTLNEYGFDYLHAHELAHEWFANMVTAEDWKHWWIHESFATYMEPLYAEYLGGEEAYHRYMKDVMSRIQNKAPIVLSQDHVSAREGYIGDVYSKGATVLHTLRYMMGKEKILQALRKMAYPDPAMEGITDGSHTRLSNSGEFQKIAEDHYGKNLDWFFDAYLHYAQLPRLLVSRIENRVDLQWESPSAYPFILSVPVEVDGESMIVEMDNGTGSFETGGLDYKIDPEGLILMEIITEKIE